MHESYSYLSVTHTLSQWGNSAWGPIITVWCLLVSILYLFLRLSPPRTISASLWASSTVFFYFWDFFLLRKKVWILIEMCHLFWVLFFFNFFFWRVKGCKREVNQAGMKFQSSVLVNTFTGFQSDLLPAISTFSNVTCCLLGKNKPPYC